MVTIAKNIGGYAHYVVDSQNVGDTINFAARQSVYMSFTVVEFEASMQERFRELCALPSIYQMNIHFQTSRRGDAQSDAILEMVNILVEVQGLQILFLDFSAETTQIGNVGASILSGLRRIRSPYLRSLKLDLSDNGINGNGAMAFAFVQPHLTTMSLNLNHNQITGDGALSLVTALGHMFLHLELRELWLGLADNKMGARSLRRVIDWKNCVRSNTLCRLFLNITGNPGLSASDISALNQGYPLLHWDEREWDTERDAAFHG